MAFQLLDFEIIFYMNGMKLFIIGILSSQLEIYLKLKNTFSAFCFGIFTHLETRRIVKLT